MNLLRQASSRFSTWNRTKKLKFIQNFIVANDIKSCLIVGANSNSNTPGFVNLIEHEIERFLNLQVGTRIVISGIESTGIGWKNWIQADGRDLPFRTHEFDLVFSNAVIEHVGDKTDQNDFLRETDRVGRNWIVTTPNRLFPVESHTQVLFKHMNSNWKHSSFSRLLSKRDLLLIIPMGSRIIGRWFSPTFICYKSQNSMNSN